MIISHELGYHTECAVPVGIEALYVVAKLTQKQHYWHQGAAKITREIPKTRQFIYL